MTKMLNSSAVYFMNNLYRSFKTIGLVGKPRNDINLQMHKNLFHWLTERGYQVMMEKDIAEKLKEVEGLADEGVIPRKKTQ